MRRAVIIGATSGVGRHVATRLAEKGWEVTVTGRRPQSTVDLPPTVDYAQADLTRPETLDVLTGVLRDRAADLVVHNATSYGDPTGGRPVLDDLETMFRINALMPFCVLDAHLRSIDESQFCSFVVVNSDSIFHASEQTSGYAASKAALRVLTSALAAGGRERNLSVSTLLLGPLADPRKLSQLDRIAERRGLDPGEVTRQFLRRSNPSFVIDSLIDFESCVASLEYIVGLGQSANGLMCRLDGGSSGSLI